MLMMARTITNCDDSDDDYIVVDRHIHKVRGIANHCNALERIL